MDPGKIYFKTHLQYKHQKQFTQDIAQTSKTITEHLDRIEQPFFYYSINVQSKHTLTVLYDTPHQRKVDKRDTNKRGSITR